MSIRGCLAAPPLFIVKTAVRDLALLTLCSVLHSASAVEVAAPPERDLVICVLQLPSRTAGELDARHPCFLWTMSAREQ